MKRIRSVLLILIIIFSLCACSKQKLADMTTEVHDDYTAIIWEDKTYIPYCVVSRTECGNQIGILTDSENNKIYEYKGYSTDEWIVDFYATDNIAMLMKEIDVTDIPAGLESEYEWNK